MKFNYDGRYFRTVGNSPGGETSSETVFHYRQEGDVVWATYRGGEVLFGTLLAKADDAGRLDMRYRQLRFRCENGLSGIIRPSRSSSKSYQAHT